MEINIANLHDFQRNWKYLQDGYFTVSYDFLEKIFEKQAQKEAMIGYDNGIHIKSLEINNDNRSIQLVTEIYKLLEN